MSLRSISEATRRNIADATVLNHIRWSGRFEEQEFLARLYDLKSIPSTDPRFKDAAGDIWQHRVRNNDWNDDWVFYDRRFALLQADDDEFLRFLCEMLHPVVQPDAGGVGRVRSILNEHLAADGWEIVEVAQVSGRPVYGARRCLSGIPAPTAPARAIATALDASYLSQQITRMESAIDSDTELAIGTAKEFVETICKTILSESGAEVPRNADLLELVRKVRDKLDLLPEGVPEGAKGADIVKRVLGSLGTVAQGIAELRGLYGTGHGKEAGVRPLDARHARLAVAAAIALGVFLYETYQARGDTP